MKINDILFEFAPSGGGDSGNYFQALASAWYNGVFNTGSLPKGIKTQEDVERLLNRGIVCPDGKTRKLHIDYNSDFDGVEIYSDDYYEYGDHDDTIDSRTGQKWGPYDFMAFSDEDLSEGINEFVTPQAVAQDPGLEREKDVDVIFFGRMPRDYRAEDAWAALEEVLPAEYPAGSERAQLKTAEVAKSGGAVVTTKPLSIAKKLVATFNGYGIKSRINGNLNEFAADGGDSGEDDVLHKYARMWWNGDDATQQKIEKILDRMGWEIGEDEGGYDNGGVFVVRAGDENGNSYQSWAAEDLTEGVAEDSTAHDCKHCNGKGYHTVTKKDGTKVATNCPQCKGKGYIVTKGVAEGLLEDEYDKMLRDLLKARPDLTKKYSKDVQRSKDIESGKELNKLVKKNPGVLKTYSDAVKRDKKLGMAEGELDEKSTSQAQFRTMAAAAHNPEFAKKVGIKQSVAREFNQADRGQDYKSLPKKADESKKAPAEKEADYGDDYQAMVQRVKKLAGMGPLKTQYDPQKRVYRNMPTAVQPKK